jgi:hypothetical protein
MPSSRSSAGPPSPPAPAAPRAALGDQSRRCGSARDSRTPSQASQARQDRRGRHRLMSPTSSPITCAGGDWRPRRPRAGSAARRRPGTDARSRSPARRSAEDAPAGRQRWSRGPLRSLDACKDQRLTWPARLQAAESSSCSPRSSVARCRSDGEAASSALVSRVRACRDAPPALRRLGRTLGPGRRSRSTSTHSPAVVPQRRRGASLKGKP